MRKGCALDGADGHVQGLIRALDSSLCQPFARTLTGGLGASLTQHTPVYSPWPVLSLGAKQCLWLLADGV